MVIYNNAKVDVRPYWYPRFTYNTTPGSRTFVTDTIKNGYVFCVDPEAYTDEASLPTATGLTGADAVYNGTQMILRGEGAYKYCRNVVKPTTGVLGLFAGVVVNAPPEGFTVANTPNGVQLELAYSAEYIRAWCLGDMSTSGYETMLGPVDGQWYLGIIGTASATDSTSLVLGSWVARPLVRTNVSSAALTPVRLGASGHW